jgi:DNA-binding transcriptional regulator YiaG
MTLKEYRDKYKLKNAQLARLFKVSEACVHHWINGYSQPGYKNAAIICQKTKGEVTLQDLGLI